MFKRWIAIILIASGIIGLVLTVSASSDAICSSTCLAAPEPIVSNDTSVSACNTTATTCNETTAACNETGIDCNNTVPACNETDATCNETTVVCNGTEGCNVTTLACNETTAFCNETKSACNGSDIDCNGTARLSCNETTLECLYGCQEAYGGERCQFKCANNCLNCTVGSCDGNCTDTCDNNTCSQSESCTDGCLDGLYGQNCSLPCPVHCLNSTCDRDSGICLHGCGGEYFGDHCELSCSPNCAKNASDAGLTCNKTTFECLYGCITNFEGDRCDRCVRGHTGPQCNHLCDYNCQNCTWKNGVVGCALCLPGYYYFNIRCEECRDLCLRNASSDIPTCNPIGGACNLGCKNGWYGEKCNMQCGALCINRTCDINSGCCSKGCKYDNYGGCQCQTPCHANCKSGTCDQEEACTQGCELNTWGPKCDTDCSLNCVDAQNNTISRCNRTGVCTFGCKATFMGPSCSERCPTNCKGNDCNATNGHCLQGCKKDYWKEKCNTNCSVNCLLSHSGEATCNQDTGACVVGCVTGQFGPICDQDCPVECKNRTCDRYNATCVLGCNEGYTGENCTDQFHPTIEGTGPGPEVLGATAGGSGFALLILVIVALVLRNRYIAFKEDAEMKAQDRKTIVLQDKIKKQRAEALGVFNPGFGLDFEKIKDEGVLVVSELLDYIINTPMDVYEKEFQKLPPVVQRPEKQKRKNTVKGTKSVKFSTETNAAEIEMGSVLTENIFVDILENGVTERTYNASRIEVYSRKYIAAEGSCSSSLVDFWLLAWSTSAPVIVMLTPTSINKHSSSVRYWPEHGKREIYGKVTVTNIKEDTYANFVHRELEIEKESSSTTEKRTIIQLQLNLWPDDKKLPNIADLIDFYMYFRAVTRSDPEPVLVHCSDGEGRTGVFIAMDLLVKDGEKFEKINFLDCVRTLREQRDNMVLTLEQYKFLYTLVAQTLHLRCKPVLESEFVESWRKGCKPLESNALLTAVEDAYENMRAAVVIKPVDEGAIKRQWNLKLKNRESSDIPEDQYRPSLQGGIYINAAFIDTLHKKELITTPMPLPKTVEDFYKMIAAVKSHVIVMMNSATAKDKTWGVYWPEKGRTVKHGHICATLGESRETSVFKQMSLTLSDYSKGLCGRKKEVDEAEHTLSMFQLKTWESGPRPSSTSSMLKFIQAVKSEREKYENGPVVVHCLNGSERSGVFCALYELTEAIERGLAFSVINTVYKIKYRRPSAILNLDQFKFIHEALETFITSEEFRGQPKQVEVAMIQADCDD